MRFHLPTTTRKAQPQHNLGTGRADARPFLAKFVIEVFDMNKPSMQIGLGIGLGAGIGAAFAVALGTGGVWLAVGIAVGIAIGASMSRNSVSRHPVSRKESEPKIPKH